MTSDMSSYQGGSWERQRPPRQGELLFWGNSSVAELDLSFPPSWVPTPFSLISLEMRADFGNWPAWGPLVGQERRVPLWFCDNILRIKEGEKKKHLRGIADASEEDVELQLLAPVQIPLWRNFCFPFLSRFEGESCSEIDK